MLRAPLAAILIAMGVSAPAATAHAAEEAAPHPLMPLLRTAYHVYRQMDQQIQDYTCVLTKRERVNGRLRGYETMVVKIRHQQALDGRVVTPFSVYVRFLRPARLKGREVLYVHGKNHGKMIVHNGGTRFEYITTAVPPDSPVALQHNRYPITEIGVKNLTRRLIEDGQEELQYDDVRLSIAPGAKVDGRPCTMIEVSHAAPREGLSYQFARILFDDVLQIPVHYSAYDWPKEPGGAPRLIEEYTYTKIRINVGLTDADFDHRNERYGFLKSFTP